MAVLGRYLGTVRNGYVRICYGYGMAHAPRTVTVTPAAAEWLAYVGHSSACCDSGEIACPAIPEGGGTVEVTEAEAETLSVCAGLAALAAEDAGHGIGAVRSLSALERRAKAAATGEAPERETRRCKPAAADDGTLHAVHYLRVSTDSQAASGLGIEAQREACKTWTWGQAHEIAGEFTDEGVSGSVAPGERPGLSAALAMLDSGEATALVCASLSRLGRSVRDVLDIADRARRDGWTLVLLDLGADTSTAAGRATLGMLSVVAEMERDLAAERTTAALAAAKARGQRLGAPVADSVRAAGQRAVELRGDGLSWRAVAETLTAEGHETAKGGPWHAMTAKRAAETVRLDAEAAALRGDA